MPHYFWPSLLALIGATCLVVGLLGIVRGGQIAKERGPDALMHYPAPLFWLKNRLTAARWVQWIGRLYLMTAVVLVTMAFGLGLNSKADMHSPVCMRLSEALVQSSLARSDWRAETVKINVAGCDARIVGADGTRWFSIQSSGTDGLIGEGFRHQTRELERSGMALKPVSNLGRRAILATPRTRGLANPTLTIDDGLGVHTIEMNGLNINKADHAAVIMVIRNSLATNVR